MKRVTTNTMMLKICVVPPDLCAHVNIKNDSCAVVRGLVGKLRRLGSNVHSRGGQLNKMADGRSFREVALHSDRNGGKTADFTIATTLTTTVKDEDYAKSHVGGGYAYRESGLADAVTRNRFIFWSVL